MNTTDKIANLLEKGRSITPIKALEKFGCFRLGARIWDLRQMGYRIETLQHRTPSGKIVAKYKLAKP
jgi:hypothetical protein